MDISDLVRTAYIQAKEKGFHDHDDTVSFGDRIALIHSEASEAMEAYRKAGMDPWEGFGGKPEGVASELADVVIRVADMCATYGIDLQEAIKEKLAYNRTRPHMHGITKTNPLARI